MAVLLIITYDVTDSERYADYNPGSLAEIMGTIDKHGGQAVAAGPPEVVVGSAEHTAVCISLPDADAARARLDNDEYAPLKAIRYESTDDLVELPLGHLEREMHPRRFAVDVGQVDRDAVAGLHLREVAVLRGRCQAQDLGDEGRGLPPTRRPVDHTIRWLSTGCITRCS